MQDDKQIDPERKIEHMGFDEISLKKRHKLYVTVMTDLTDPNVPKVLAVARGKDKAAAQQCLDKLTPEQREAVQTHRVDMGHTQSKRCYGVKSAHTFFKRIVLDLNRAAQALGRSIAQMREITAGLKAVFLQYCT